MAALKLRDEARLRLEDSTCRYLDNCPDNWQEITVQQLMRHNSGIPDYEEPLGLGSTKYLAFMTQPDANLQSFENAKKLPLDFKPGEKFSYSNTGYIVLSFVIQKVAGEPFTDFVTNNILEPAGMKNSGVINAKKLPNGLASGYFFDDIGWERTLAGVPLTDGQLKKMPQLSLTSPEGDDFLYSTIDDLYRWSLIMDGANERIVYEEELSEVFEAGMGGYGYGWFVEKGFNRTRHRHSGDMPGYISDFIKFPDDKITIIVFSNLDRARLSYISRDLTAIVLGTPFDMPVNGKVIKLTAEQISNLAGEYEMADGKILRIYYEPKFLTDQLQDRYIAGLIPLSPNEFYFPLGGGKAVFILDKSGRATKVNIRYGGEDHIATRRE